MAEGVDTQIPLVRAGGGVVWRAGANGETEVLVVHRPKYDDWSLPKGKRDAGESDEACALREVEEETGLRCTLGPELASSAYIDRKGRPKEVRWWVMTAVDGAFVATEEVDEVRWLSMGVARALLSYDRDREILDSFVGGS
ncbi:MAG: NUDIX hydrolase [Acidobacteria bacterium]|nr:NUDIX hydrolase [Acidobacteriota bacterium]